MALNVYDNGYLVHMYVAIARSHPLAIHLLKDSHVDWLLLGLRRFWLEAVGSEMIFRNLEFGSDEWATTLALHQKQYDEALAFAPTYALNTDEVILADCMDRMVPYSLWVLMSSHIERERFERIREEVKQRYQENLEQYADF